MRITLDKENLLFYNCLYQVIMFKPLLAAKFDNDPEVAQKQMEAIRFPVLGSFKIDGIRARVSNGVLLSRKNKPIPNIHVQGLYGESSLNGLDGELVVGKPNSYTCFNRTSSVVMSYGKRHPVDYHVFDFLGIECDLTHLPYRNRNLLLKKVEHPYIIKVKQYLLNNLDDLLRFEDFAVRKRWEGIMIRDPEGYYKQGRSTLSEGILIKLKRFSDSEAIIIDCYEQETNNNEAKIDEIGRSKRSSHKANKISNGLMGGFVVRDLISQVEFNIGTMQGVTSIKRKQMWEEYCKSPQDFIGRELKYKYLLVGMKDKPRHPIFLGWRED